MLKEKLTKPELYSRCIIWEKIRAEYFEARGASWLALECEGRAIDYERKYRELPEVAHLYSAPQGVWR
jgi:hypothetical protein